MRYFVIALIILTSQTACATPRNVTEYGPFADIVAEFESYAYPRIVTNRIIFADLADTNEGGRATLAICNTWTKVIRIHKPYWDRVSPDNRAIVLLHELGHCTGLSRDHLNTLRADGTPMSLMRESPISERVFVANRQYYLTELINGTDED